MDDINFYPCTCGYQICRFCWNKLRTEGNGLCPACRQAYTENPADFKPLTSEEMAKIKAEKRQKDQAKKQKITENRKHLANVRVVQKNLVFVVGLSPRLAEPEILKKPDYFGKFGKIHKVVINHSTQYAGSQMQGPSASAYVTYLRSEDALRAIQAVNNIFIDGRTLKASLGTTKYCSHFMKNQSCPKNDCMYLHELGDEQASFTKEQMQQGKHTEYEKALHEEMLSSLQPPASPSPTSLGGGEREESDWSQHWGGSGGEDWGRPSGSEQTWPDLGNTGPPYKGRFIGKDEDKSKSKSCSSSDCDSSSLPGDSRSPGDQVVPTSEGGPGLADAAWEGDTGPSQSALCAVSEESNVSTEQEQEHRQGWLDNDLKNSNNFLDDDDDVDDLGFDPFHETQKGLADLLESEAAEAQQQAKVSSPSPDWRTHLPTPPAARAKLPPPGFHNTTSSHHLPPHNNLGGNFSHGGFGGPSGLNPPSTSSAVDSLFGLARGRSGGAPGFGGQQTSQDFLFGLGGSKSGSGLGLGGLGLGERHVGPHLQDNFSSKDWQDGLRALLPNVNVSFGQGQGGANNSGLGHFGLQNNFQPSYSQQQERQERQQGLQHNSNWGSGLSNGLGNDWTMLDPAIVSGQLAHEAPQHQLTRPESPHNWLAANLEQLSDSAGPYSSQTNLIPAFNGLGLGDRLGAGARGRVSGGGWGGPTTATPPPGFSHHRQNMGHYQGFGNKNSEAHKIGEF